MANRNQLRVLNDTQATAIRAAGNGLAVAELVKIYWPSPTGAKVYAWWDLLADPVYADSDLETWLDGAPLIPAFIAQDEAKTERFHEIPRTAAIGDDVIRMRFRNSDGAFETLCATHKAGVKVEVFYYYPGITDGLAVHWFSGHLRTPENVDKDFVDITVAEGLRSADLLLPNRVHASQCTWASQFGGLFDPLLPNNPCDYDRHTGGSRGNLNAGNPYTSCDGTKASCTARMGDLLSYGGFDAVQDVSTIGFGSNQTQSKTVGQTNRMSEPVQVIYGETQSSQLVLLDYAKEYNLSHPDEGTIRTLFEISEGPIEEVTDFELMDEPLPRPDGLGLQVKLGTQQQTPTTYSTNVLNYNRLAHARADKNPWNPNGVQPSSIVAKCKAKGRNTVRVYSDADTYTEEYTNLRAWVMLDLMTDTVYGHREAIERHYIPDLIYLANTTGTTFNGVVQGKSAQQQITDICLGGKWFLPFMHKDANQTLAQWRWLPIEDYDLEADDIPTFTDTGASRNILKDARGLSRIKVSRRDDDKIPNEWTLTFSDAQHKYLERPLLFADSDAQKLAGEVYGDGSLRKVPDTETAFGVTDETTAREVGFYLLDYGRFYTGGIKNNGTVEFVTSHLLWPEALDLHQNKVIKIVSDKLNNLKDPNGDVFTHFIVTAMQTTSRGELVVTCQAFGALRTVEPTVSLCNLHPAPTSPYAGVRFHGSSFNLNRDWAPGGIDPPYPFTVAGRFSIDEDTGDTSGQTICTTGLLGSEWWLGVTPGLKLTFRSNAGDTYGSALTAGQEYHIAVVTKADGARLVYLDGVLDITTTGQAPDDWPAYERGYFLLFGRVGFIGSKILQGGTFRAWKVWDAELTVDEIDEEAGAYYACRTADLWAAWTMENVDRDTWDRSPNCRDLGREGSPVDTTATGLSNLPFYCGGATTGGGGTTGGTTLTSPPDYYLAVDQVRREVVHSWTHVSPITGVNYEIRLDAGGSPGSLVWMGFANQFREAVNVEGSRTYHFRAFTSTVNGNWIVRTINVDYTSGQDDQWILPTQVFDDANVSSGVTGYDRLGIEVFG